MRPRSIAIIGISPEPSSAGFLALRTLEEFDYRGPIHLVSRNQTNIGDRACLRAIDNLPDGVDAAMLSCRASPSSRHRGLMSWTKMGSTNSIPAQPSSSANS